MPGFGFPERVDPATVVSSLGRPPHVHVSQFALPFPTRLSQPLFAPIAILSRLSNFIVHSFRFCLECHWTLKDSVQFIIPLWTQLRQFSVTEDCTFGVILRALKSLPQYATAEAQTGGPGAINFAISYVIESLDLDSPVLFVEIKPPMHLPSISAVKTPKTKSEPGSCNLLISSEYRSCTESMLSDDDSPTTHMKEPPVLSNLLLWKTLLPLLWTLPLLRGGTRICIMQEEGRARFLAAIKEIRQMVRDLWYESMYSV
ncbi:hypothetical protein EDB89DRAFT_2073850 [Lactarius sanguifluus]|nr:hypothetical protein EDB89DRAFT_2073850 [Lactarius sanguifluus]